MRTFFTPIFSLVAILLTGVVANGSGQRCDYHARGPALEQKQRVATKDFAHIFLVEKDPVKAFSAYVPGKYIQHDPQALDGRDAAIAYLLVRWATPEITFTNITSLAGEGFGVFHYRMKSVPANIDFAVMFKLRFEGTCFVENWDVLAPIYGNETNPHAYF